MLMKNIFALLILFTFYFADGQQGIVFNSPEATTGYSLFTAEGSTYLVDNCGDIVHRWNVSGIQNHTKLLPDGNLLYMSNNRITERNWQDAVVTSVIVTDPTVKLAYEVIKLKNKNYLCIGRESITLSKMQEHGYNIQLTQPTISDVVVEIDHLTGKVVWRWNLFDHIIQDVSPTKKSFGVLKDNPGKININAISTYDWEYTESFMINGMDYNEELDQIVLSVRKINEIVIIDHSTTTEQAMGSTGGKYKKGGDLLYRYGNPANYKRGTESQHQLYFQHNPNWIKYGEHKGKIAVFNNNLSKNANSTVQIISPPIQTDGTYFLENEKPYAPLIPDVEYGKTDNKVNFASGYTSGASVLPNGNIIITEGVFGRLLEIKPDETVVWEYIVPNVNYIFRTERYDQTYPAFAGKTLVPNGNVEFPPSNYNCKLFSSYDDELQTARIAINTIQNEVSVDADDAFEVNIFNLAGQLLHKQKSDDGILQWRHNIASQIVFLQFNINGGIICKKTFVY